MTWLARTGHLRLDLRYGSRERPERRYRRRSFPHIPGVGGAIHIRIFVPILSAATRSVEACRRNRG
jgi:hypothetical protein